MSSELSLNAGTFTGDVQAIEEVGTDPLVPNLWCQITVDGGEQPRIRAKGSSAS
jgi:hypothetical protein